MDAKKNTAGQLTVTERALIKALRPFAEAMKHFESGPGGHLATDRVGFDSGLTVGDLISACDAIAKATRRLT